mmetsp:Transcript_24839/g.67668  ORF Transcript_24839/g.67668 Transcript_24839/m.67668 type:complete len:82 (+) Transcript_24839:2229-2474(+)
MAQQVPPWFQNVHSCNITVQAAEYVVQQSGMMLQQEQQQQGGIKSATKQHAKKYIKHLQINCCKRSVHSTPFCAAVEHRGC